MNMDNNQRQGSNPAADNEKARLGRDQDLPDTPEDEQKMRQEEVTLDLPDVGDIPGQENVVPPKMGEFADTTISSDDEEGTRIFGDDREHDLDDPDA